MPDGRLPSAYLPASYAMITNKLTLCAVVFVVTLRASLIDTVSQCVANDHY